MTRTRLPAPLLWLIIALMLAQPLSGAMAQTPEASPAATPITSETAPESFGVQYADMDLTVHPGDDFYQFANGGWLSRTELPGDSPTYGAFDEINDRVEQELLAIINGFEADTTTPSGKARSIFDQVLDVDTRNNQGIDPIQPLLDEFEAITSIEEGLAFQQVADTYALGGLFYPYAAPSPDDATVVSANIIGPALSLPAEDYYGDDETSLFIQQAWIDTTTQLLIQLGYTEEEAATAAETVIEFEKALVSIKTPDAELQSNPTLMNNPRTLEELEAIFPALDWQAFVVDSHFPDDLDTIIVNDLPYLEGLGDILAETDPFTLKYLFTTQLIWSYSDSLTTEIEDLTFNSYIGPVLLGTTEQAPMDERALGVVQGSLPDTLSEAYVAEYFPPEAKAEIEELVDNIIAAYRIRIQNSPWMSEETKAKALEKLDLMVTSVGYPDSFETYDDVEVGESLFETYVNAYQAANKKSLGEAGGPVDRTEWGMNAFDVNAGYSRSLNTMIYPAAILQAPFFDPNADLASNYGGIGAVIGHEITHGFDLGGSQYDGYGNLVSWWTDEDRAAFSALNDEVIARYSSLEVAPGLNVDGELTVTENVADMGGVQVAYDAMLIAIDEGDQENTPWFLTQQQRFAIAWATVWRSVITPQYLELLVSSDVHAPASIRSVEPLLHLEAFYEAFDIDTGDPEYLPPEQRIVIW
jgi:putative endopeptidase